jgi:hypothetical protein
MAFGSELANPALSRPIVLAATALAPRTTSFFT